MTINKMLIDASHPEETRVAVVRGNRIEEFDFESQEKQQLRGNIYLAKVTRVEPSLQAAFVDYGGNRHGFLAFSEIHPDYYQIPVADRQALLEAEAAEARASRDEEDKADASLADTEDGGAVETAEADAAGLATETEKPKKTRRPRRRSKAKSPAENAATDEDAQAAEAPDALSAGDGETAAETELVAEETVEVDSPSPDEEDTGDSPKTIAAIVDTNSISEPASDPEEGDDADDTNAEVESSAAETAKPKRRTTRRKRPTVSSEDTDVQASADDASPPPEFGDDQTTAAAVEAGDIANDGQPQPDEAADDEAQEATKPKRRRTARRKPKKSESRATDAVEPEAGPDDRESRVDADSGDNGDNSQEDDVESVGREDALEEVPERRKSRRQYKIQEVIKRRQVLLVQVVKEERGNKGAALTTYLSLAGRYSVLMPNTARGGGISRKITNANDRKRLKAIANELAVPDGMGVILRTAGASRTKAEIKRDFEYLMRLWEKVRNLTLASSAPCLVYEEGSLIKRSIRDLYNKEIGEILVSGEAGYKEASDFMVMLMPSHSKNVKLYKEPQTIFSKFGVEAQLDRMVTPQVTLKSGGYLVMNQTEALVAIDVNSGRSTREHSIEDTALQTNLEAAEEVARQLRLRDLAGLIVIDFIDMEEKRNNRSVEKKLKDCLKDDRARIQVGRISHFGLLEMSRQRIRASVLESTMDVCPHCQGLGHVRSDSAIALHVFRAIVEYLGKHSRYDVVVKTTPAIALYVLNHKRMALTELEARFGLNIAIEGDMNIQGQEFSIEKGEPARGAPNGISYLGAEDAVEIDDTSAGNGADADAVPDDEDEGGDRKKKRRRRRAKKRPDAAEEAEAEAESDELAPVPEDMAASADAEDALKNKRRRGKRGGRRRRGEDDMAAETEGPTPSQAAFVNEPESADVEPEAPVTAADVTESEQIAAESGERTVRSRRSTRRPRKTKAADTTGTAAEPAEAESRPAMASAEAAAMKTSAQTAEDRNADEGKSGAAQTGGKARRTRNAKPADDSQSVVGHDEPEPTDEAAAGQPAEEPDKKQKKRGGWWTGGFF